MQWPPTSPGVKGRKFHLVRAASSTSAVPHCDDEARLPCLTTGAPAAPSGTSWTSVYSDELVRIGAERSDVVAITALVRNGTGAQARPSSSSTAAASRAAPSKAAGSGTAWSSATYWAGLVP